MQVAGGEKSCGSKVITTFMGLGFSSSLRIHIGSCVIATDSIRE